MKYSSMKLSVMNLLISAFISLTFISSVLAKELKLGNSVNQMIRLQTVDPLAENRVPLGSPLFSGKKASKSFTTEKKGHEQDKVKSKSIIAGAK
ncbi:hypothetical protein L4D09_21890 [Photobacterium makurazakiensis]|uniref:hypothetical protein n=1 Tax=Photobacterium makurazakiensis TaxID=2910234 RepID=UPI003D0C80FA